MSVQGEHWEKFVLELPKTTPRFDDSGGGHMGLSM